MNGSSQDHIAAINPGAGGSLASWGTHLSYPVIDLAADSHGVYVAGAGGGGNFAGLSPTGATLWQGGTNGNVQAIGVVGGTSTSAATCSSTAGRSMASTPAPRPLPRDKLLAVDETTGGLLSWAPGADSALGVFALTGDSATGNLFSGGDFRHTGNHAQQGFAEFSN